MHQAAHDAFSKAIATDRSEFGSFFLSRFLGLEISYPDDSCVVDLDVQEFMFNPQGVLHGGITALILDVSMGHLVNRAAGAPGMTVQMTTQYIRPIRLGRSRCSATFLKQGRRVSFLEARLLNEAGKLAAKAAATFQMPIGPMGETSAEAS